MIPGEAGKKGKRVSINSKNVLDIQPIVYTFKVPPHSHASGSVVTAARPPQWLYHDHVMGVIWMIFHKEKNYVGISQLQWCLRFLLDLKNAQGEHTGDVEICIQAIQDNLIEQYAKLGPALQKSIESKYSLKNKRQIVVAEDKQSAINEKSGDNGLPNISVLEDNLSKGPMNTNVTDSTNNNEKEGGKDVTMPQIQGIIGTSTPKENEARMWKRKTKEIIKKSEKHCGATCTTNNSNRQKEETLSFTYNEMMSRGPAPCTEPYLIEDTYSGQQSVEHIEEHPVNLANLNLSDLVNFLNPSREQDVIKINIERETLRIIERLVENMKTSSFPTKVVEDLTKRLENLPREDVTKDTEEITKLNE